MDTVTSRLERRVLWALRFFEILNEGINKNEFSINDANQTFNFIYGILLESMIMIHDDPDVNILDQVISTVKKIVTK